MFLRTSLPALLALAACAPDAGDSASDSAEQRLDATGASDMAARIGVELCGNGLDDDGDGSTDEDCDSCDTFVTRLPSFWALHECVIDGDANGIQVLPITLGASETYTTAAEVAAVIDVSTSGEPHERLREQLLTLALNAEHFHLWNVEIVDRDGDGDPETVAQLWERANATFDGGNLLTQAQWANQLREINRAGQTGDAWFDDTCVADPEYCDGIDNDGDGEVDEACSCEEICDGADNNGDGVIDEGCGSCETAVSRRPLFWANQSCAIDGETGLTVLPLRVGSGIEYTSAADIVTWLGAAPGADRYLRLERQIIALKLNIAFFGLADTPAVDGDGDGVVETYQQLADMADDVYDTATVPEVADMAWRLRQANSLWEVSDVWFDNTCSDVDVCTGEGDDSDTCGCVEVCDGHDNDGDGLVDEGYSDEDGDGTADCVPDSPEVCDGIDNDGDGRVDEGNVCPIECEAPTDCLTVWEAHGMGVLDITNVGDGTEVWATNTGDTYDICVDEQVIYFSDDSQSFFFDYQVTTRPLTLSPGESSSLYYGSWTTDNDGYSPYLGEDAWWCIDNDAAIVGGTTFPYSGEGVPDRVAELVEPGFDSDGDGNDDLLDWVDYRGVLAQVQLWEYQAEHVVLSVGKIGWTADTTCGVDIALTVRNNGDVAGTGTVTDTLPAGWSIDEYSHTPDSAVVELDGTTTLTWTVALDGKLDGGWSVELIEYSTTYDAGADLGYQYFPPATVDYDDGDGLQTSVSMPVGLYDLDLDCSGDIECPEEEVCDGEDNDHDGDIDEGYVDTDEDGIADCVDEEECDGLDNDGDGDVDEGYSDTDGDGTADCIDVEECDGLDNDGDGAVDEDYADTDGDGIADCVDVEECDGLDNDGDGAVDEDYADTDGDGIADCIDEEECDGLDNDGDGDIDEGYEDHDMDGIADCIDVEECDGLDNDGDGDVDEGYADTDGDGTADCIDVEECDGLDNDGDGAIDEDFTDTDGDGIADCQDEEECDELDNDGDGDVDEDNVCGDGFCDPPVDCLSIWQAHALDLVLIESDGFGEQIVVTNLSDTYSVCLDEQIPYTSDGTQAFFWGLGVVTEPIEVGPGDTAVSYYGSYTTDNDAYAPHLGEPDWWCLQIENPVSAGEIFDYFGEGTPAESHTYAELGYDTDGSGVDDLLEWVDWRGVQGQYNLWDYQADYALLTVGKTAQVVGTEVEVVLTVRNFGEHDGGGTVTDVVPAGWTLETTSPAPDTRTDEADGSTTLEWTVAVPAMDGATVYAETLTYTMSHNAGTDLGYLELDVAGVEFELTSGLDDISLSMPAAVYNLDLDGNGSIACPE